MDISDEEFELANRRAEEMRRTIPFAVEVRLAFASRVFLVALNTGDEITVPLSAFRELATATESQLVETEISPSGNGIHFPALDVDLYVPALLEEFGSPSLRSLGEQARRFI